jgi:hypothetical protein
MAFMTLLYLVLFASGLYVLKTVLQPKAKHPPLPPGPKPKPLIGNLTDLPKTGEQEWQHWLKHRDVYGSYNQECDECHVQEE